MKAVRKLKKEPGLAMESVPEPIPGPSEVVLNVQASSLCGTDGSIYSWSDWAKRHVTVPVTLGHEMTGTVVQTGKEVGRVEEGDTVSVESHVYCDSCSQCRDGYRHLCHNLSLVGVNRAGGFADYACIPERCVWEVSSEIPASLRTLLEPIGNAVYATCVEEVTDREVVVFGCGPTGLFSVGVANALGASRIIGIENRSFRRDLAKKMGADMVLDGRDDRLQKKLSETLENDGGADVILEMSGHHIALQNALEALAPGGRISVFGLQKKDVPINISDQIILKGARVYGIFGREIFSTWEQVMELLDTEEFAPSTIITDEYPLEEYEQGFEKLFTSENDCGKIIFRP